jgi:RND family efflux transporter MFP subunit
MKSFLSVVSCLCLGVAAFAADPVPPAAADPAPAASSLQIRAKLSPVRYALISAEVSAKVDKLPFAEGARFRAGEALVVFESSVYRAQADKARAQSEAAERIVTAYRRLAEQGSVGQLELLSAEARAAEAKADKELTQVMLSKCTVSVPFAGRVGELRIREQQYVQSGQPLIEVIDDSTLELEFITTSASLAWLRVGQKFAVKIDETGKSYQAVLTRIGAKVDPVSQTIKLAASIQSGNAELLAGMSGTIDLKAPTK